MIETGQHDELDQLLFAEMLCQSGVQRIAQRGLVVQRIDELDE